MQVTNLNLFSYDQSIFLCVLYVWLFSLHMSSLSVSQIAKLCHQTEVQRLSKSSESHPSSPCLPVFTATPTHCTLNTAEDVLHEWDKKYFIPHIQQLVQKLKFYIKIRFFLPFKGRKQLVDVTSVMDYHDILYMHVSLK